MLACCRYKLVSVGVEHAESRSLIFWPAISLPFANMAGFCHTPKAVTKPAHPDLCPAKTIKTQNVEGGLFTANLSGARHNLAM